MKVPFFDYPRLYLDDKENLLSIFDKTASSGAFIMQQDLEEFEKKLATYSDAKYAIGVANATDGLELALMSIGLNKGDEVICCSHTMLATAAAILLAGGKPVPVEMGDDNLIDYEAIEDAITPNTVGIMPTQLNGRTCNMDKINSIKEKYKLFLVEDAAQALGSKFKGRNAGTFGTASAISFFPAKVLGCLGDAGGVLTNDPETFNKIYQLHDHGRDINGEVKSWGRNSRLDNLQAAFLNYKFNDYDNVVKRRRKIAEIYDKNLSELEELKLPPSPDSDKNHFDVYQNYEIECDNRNELKEYLYKNGIGTIIQWGGKGIHQWEGLGYEDLILPKTERFFNRCILLPMNQFITDQDVKYVCYKIIQFYKSK